MQTLMRSLLVMVMLMALTIPAVAQTDSDPDTETLTLENYSVVYPASLTNRTYSGQIELSFTSTQYITIATPIAFAEYGIPNDTLFIAAEAVYEVFAEGFSDTRTLEQALERIAFANYDEAYLYTTTASGTYLYAYVFAIGDEIFAATLITNAEDAAIRADQVQILEDVLASLTVDGELAISSAEATPIIFVEATPDVLLSDDEPRLAPLDAMAEVELAQSVSDANNTVTLAIPADWVIQDLFGITLADSQATLDALDEGSLFPEDAVILQVVGFEAIIDIAPDMDGVIAFVSNQLEDISPVITYGNLDHVVYLLFGKDSFSGDALFVLIFELAEADVDAETDTFGVIVGIGDYDAYEAEILAIMQSLRYP